MKNKLCFIAIILFVCMLTPSVYAAKYVGIVTGSGVRVRSLPGTNGTIMKETSLGVIYNMPDNKLYPDQGGCPNGWFSVYVDDADKSKIGYICSDYLSVNEEVEQKPDNKEAVSQCEKDMNAAGFPSSYWAGICALKIKHPTWTFKAINTDNEGNKVSLNAAISAELGSCSNTIATSAKDDYKRTDGVCKNSLDSGYTYASEAAIKYYMDPRNFLTENYIFMFESQKTNTAIDQNKYSEVVSKMFNNNYLVQQIDYMPELVLNGALGSGMSQTAIASRIKQELGNAKLSYTYPADGTALYSVVSGNYTTRTGKTYNGSSLDNFYNFYNIAATDGSGVTEKALVYAFKQGWGGSGDKKADRQKALTNGAKWIFDRYTNKGQQTIYFNKFNTFPTTSSSRYIHQYMTNIQAPISESTILYNAYKGTNLLEAPFIFEIPVYSDISYIQASGVEEKPEDPTKPSISTIISASGFRTSNSNLVGIGANMPTKDLINKIQSNGATVTVTDPNGKAAGEKIGTGYKITINGSQQVTYNAVIYGDLNSDGTIDAIDLLKVKKHITGASEMNGVFKDASDINKDGKVDAIDLLMIKKDILGTKKIAQ